MKLKSIYIISIFLLTSSQLIFAQKNVSSGILTLKKELKSAKKKDRVDILSKLAWKYRNSNLKASLLNINESIKLARKLKYKEGLAQALNFAGVIHRKLGNYDKAMKYFFECLQVAEVLKDKHQLAYVFNNMGEIYIYQRNYKSAEPYIRKSLRIFSKLKDKEGMAYCFLRLAELEQAQNRKDKALDYLLKVAKLREEISDKRGLAVTFASIGKVYFAQDRPRVALEYLEKSLKLYATDDKSGIAQSQHHIAEVYLKMNDLAKAEKYAKTSLDLGRSFNSKKIVHEASLLLAKIYSKQGQLREALKLQEEAALIKDSLFAEEATRSINNLRESYEAEKKQISINNLKKYHNIEKAKNRSKTTLLYVSLVAIALISLFSILLYRNLNTNKRITSKVKEQNEEISRIAENLRRANQIIDLKNENITASINYAKRIQQAIFPSKKEMQRVFSEYFVFHKPRDIVSGDFYWVFYQNHKTYIVVADCTGHGIPGAFMSVIGNDLLNYIIISEGVQEVDKILDKLRKLVHQTLHQNESENRDGMDIGLCVVDTSSSEIVLDYAGATHSLYYHNSEDFYEVKGSKIIIGGFDFLQQNRSFDKHRIVLEPDKSPYTFYLSSDGFRDQFNEQGKKFMKKRFKTLLREIHYESLIKQKQLLEQAFASWKQESFQVDDVLVLGFRVRV